MGELKVLQGPRLQSGTRTRKRKVQQSPRLFMQEDQAAADISIWKEVLFGAELLLLHASPVYYGLGIPRGDGSAVVVIPGFLGSDFYLSHLHAWLGRIGYRSYTSGIGLNAECPNLLIRHKLNEVVETALSDTGRKIHLIGHSLGGIIARAVAAQRPECVASVITLGSPFRGTVAHQSILRAAATVRSHILKERGRAVLPDCYTARCTCDFVCSLRTAICDEVAQTAIYTKDDGVVDWRYCISGDPSVDFEVPGTHIGMVYNASAYGVIAARLAAGQSEK
jgi:triacylglycerol lipase